MDKEQLAKRVIEEVLGEDDVSIKLQERIGGDSVVFDVVAGGYDYVLRTSGVRSNYDLEHDVLKLVRERGVFAPRPVAVNVDTEKYPFTFSLLERIPGKNLGNVPGDIWESVLFEVGRSLSKMYEIKLMGFGSLDTSHFRQKKELVGVEKSWYLYFKNKFSVLTKEVISKLEKDKKVNFEGTKLSREQVAKVLAIVGNFEKIEERLVSLKDRLENVDGSLIHHDISFEHIFVEGGRLAGIIDFNHAAVGDKLYDTAYFSVMPHGELYQRILKGSRQKIDKELFSFYRLVTAAGKIHTRYVRHNYLHLNPEILDIALVELGL